MLRSRKAVIWKARSLRKRPPGSIPNRGPVAVVGTNRSSRINVCRAVPVPKRTENVLSGLYSRPNDSVRYPGAIKFEIIPVILSRPSLSLPKLLPISNWLSNVREVNSDQDLAILTESLLSQKIRSLFFLGSWSRCFCLPYSNRIWVVKLELFRLYSDLWSIKPRTAIELTPPPFQFSLNEAWFKLMPNVDQCFQ